MGHSYHTDPKWWIAARNAKRNAAGRILLPRIVVREPRMGDTHPIGKKVLAYHISRLPVEMYYGLRLIEMLPRQSTECHRLAEYRPKAKTIRMYSLPPTMLFSRLSSRMRRMLRLTQATVVEQKNGFLISWKDPRCRSMWFYYVVIIHELGHHHRYQYPAKTGRHGRRWDEELMAEHYCKWVTMGRLAQNKYPKKAKPSTLPNDRPIWPVRNS